MSDPEKQFGVLTANLLEILVLEQGLAPSVLAVWGSEQIHYGIGIGVRHVEIAESVEKLEDWSRIAYLTTIMHTNDEVMPISIREGQGQSVPSYTSSPAGQEHMIKLLGLLLEEKGLKTGVEVLPVLE